MAEQAAKKIVSAQAKPILKWAGGKTQMLGDLLPKVPTSFGRYIEPFFGGGAMFFALQPENAVIADSNPELINMYREVADHVEDVIQCLKQYENTSEMFYAVRSQEWTTLPKAEAAARTIFLNRTCFNGLYRVNKQGQFNVPYGKYKNPKICDEDGLRAASVALQKVDILCGDYLLVLEHYAQPGDFIFLDPPYLPVSEYIYYHGKLLRQHSIGQRASALILFILTQDDNDIIFIDQPEDDLDNKVIYDEVITAIAQKKPYMQFIFATHNANIPVLGDSERVLVVEFQESRIDVAQGNIDLDSTHKQIVDIMEGGKEAFDKRQLIYTSWR